MEDPSELAEIGNSVEAFRKLVESQRELFHSQIDALQRVVVAQCQLTGANPLSQEMAAGALSINIGKRPRDLLNPKAIKYMQSVFAVKDAIAKKESQELSALFCVSMSQVREFFNSQRSRVRKIVQLSKEKAMKSAEHNRLLEGVPTSADPSIPIDIVPLNTISPLGVNSSPLNSVAPSDNSSLPLYTIGYSDANPIPLDDISPSNSNPLPLNTIVPSSVDDAPSCSTQDDTPPGLDDADKHFVDNIFNLMRKEETFSGQVKVLELIMQIQNSSVLCWFLTKGGVMILVTWLTQAAEEEQTSVIHVILKVLCHLPLSKALPAHMSAILQSVNKLRFYRTSEISNRARVLLSRWSKSLARTQALKKPNGMKTSNDSQELALLKRSIDEAIGDDPWSSNGDVNEDILALPYEGADRLRKPGSLEPMKLLTAPSDDSNKKHILGVSSSQFKGRRKVQLVEQPGNKSAGRSSQAARTTPVGQARPMSVDDIQKAKLRAQYMQSKYGMSASSNENKEVKADVVSKLPISQASTSPMILNVPVQSSIEGSKIPAMIPLKDAKNSDASVQPIASVKPIASIQPMAAKLKTDIKEHIWEKCRRVQVPWRTPPEIKLNPEWRVGGGENGKEMEVQRNRNHRGPDTIYKTLKEIPPNPKEPWDIEMDYDDSLTPVIPTEQPPDPDCTETQPSQSQEVNEAPETLGISQEVNSVVLSLKNMTTSTAGPDLELLAVLLENPELVFALTSGKADNLSSDDTVKLLDMIKAGGAGFADSLNGLASRPEKVEVSLPSPTPSSNPGTSGWRPEATRNTFSQQNTTQNRVSPLYSSPAMAANNKFAFPSAHTSPLTHRLESAQQAAPTYTLERVHQFPNSATVPSHMQHSYSNMAAPVWGESTSNRKSDALYNSYSVAAERQSNFPPPTLPSLTQPRRHSPQPLQQQTHYSESLRCTESSHYSESPYFSKPTAKHGPPPSDSWRPGRQGVPSNYYDLESQNRYAPSYGGPLQPQPPLRSRPPYERTESVNPVGGFETWSPPEGSPTSNSEHNMYGRNAYRPAERSRQTQNPGYQNYSRQGHRWPDHRRH